MRIKPAKLAVFIFLGSLLACPSTPLPEQKVPDLQPELPVEEEYSREKVLDRILGALDSGDMEKALAGFNAFIPEDRNSVEMVLLESSVLISAGKLEEAGSIVDALLTRDAGNVEALHLKATLARAKGDDNQYKDSLERLVALDPAHADSLAELGEIAYRRKIYKLADQYWTKSLKADERNMKALLGKAAILARNEKPEEAEKYLNRAIEYWPNFADPWAARARLYKAYDLYLDALKDQEAAIERDPDNFWYLVDRARLLVDLGRKEEALADLQKAQALNPDNFLSYVYSAGINEELGQLEIAERDYRKLVSLRPDYYFAYEAIGVLTLRDGRWDEAAKAFASALEQAPDHHHYALLAGLALRKGRKDQAAKALLAEVLKTVDRDKIEWQLLRLFHDMSGDVDIAVRIEREESTEKKARMLYYLAQFYQIKDNTSLALKYHLQVRDMNVQSIVEWRLNEWAIEALEKG